MFSYLKMLRTAARTEKNGARGVLVCSRCAARRGAVLRSLRGGPNQAALPDRSMLMPALELPSAMSGTIKNRNPFSYLKGWCNSIKGRVFQVLKTAT